MRRIPVVLFLCCLAVPAHLAAQTAADYVSRGKALVDNGEYDAGIAALNQALATADAGDSESMFNAFNNRGCAWDAKGEYAKAIADFDQALAIKPDDGIAHKNRGLAWHHKGEYRQGKPYREELKKQ